ncbi:MAG: hypothetical protein EYX74_00725 [Desulfobulbaceae bacterium]|nr:MAG: hypothetical protein EYX74_00725 [Desulfobulbaceae bacterium]
MKIAELEIDWLYLRPTLIGWSLVSLVVLLCATGIYFYAQNSQKEYARLERRLQEARNNYFAAIAAQNTIIAFQDHFLALQAGGVIGKERRLEWMEQLQKQTQKLNLPKITFSLEAYAPFSLPEVAKITAPLTVSRMRLEMRLFHEGDLFALLAGLRQADIGLFWVQSCALKRDPLPEDGIIIKAPVTADCELWWLVVDPES